MDFTKSYVNKLAKTLKTLVCTKFSVPKSFTSNKLPITTAGTVISVKLHWPLLNVISG
jgi:hypothetical protein